MTDHYLNQLALAFTYGALAGSAAVMIAAHVKGELPTRVFVCLIAMLGAIFAVVQTGVFEPISYDHI